jgi:hypothetical protein
MAKRRRATPGEGQAFVDLALRIEDDECILWPFGVSSNGYGQLTGNRLVHRYVCEAKHGPPDFLKADAAHSCGTKLCINPRHLRWATRKNNLADMDVHGTRPQGVNHYAAKLTVADVQTIRASTENQRHTAERYDVSRQAISDIRRRKNWKSLP